MRWIYCLCITLLICSDVFAEEIIFRPEDDSYERVSPGILFDPPPEYYGGTYPDYIFSYCYIAPSSKDVRYAGVRYKLDIPKDAIVLRASLSFYLTSTVYDSPDLRIYYEDSGSSQPFTLSFYDISGRVLSGSSVLWQEWNLFPGAVPPVPGYDGAWFNSNDISGLVREFLTRPDWESGNHLTFILVPEGQSYFHFFSEDIYGGAYAAQLQIFFFSPSELGGKFVSILFGLSGIVSAGLMVYSLLD